MDGYTAPPLSRLSEVDDYSTEEIIHLRDELHKCQHEKSMLSDQLECFIKLVKNALDGNADSLDHVRRVTGSMGMFPENELSLTSPRVKTRAVKNWGLMTASLLHRDYNKRMTELRAISNERLEYRNRLLDQYKNKHEQQVRNTSASHLRPKSSKKTGKDLLKAEDFFLTESGDGFQEKALDALYNKTVNEHQIYKQQNKSEFKGSYDDPHRYDQRGLFDSSSIVKKSRPVSASSLKSSDSRRAKPKSAIQSGINQKTDRPLKFETTRPVSSKVRTVTSQPPTNRPTRAKTANPLIVNNKNDPIHEFSSELRAMEQMEEKFKATTLAVQKKIGIRPDGFI